MESGGFEEQRARAQIAKWLKEPVPCRVLSPLQSQVLGRHSQKMHGLWGKKGLSPRKQWLSSSLTFSMQHECFCWSTRRTCRAQGCWLLSCRRPSLMKRQEMWGKLRSALLLKRPFQNRRCWVSQSLRGPMAQWDTWAPWELQFCLDNSGCSKTGGWTSGRERWSAGAADFGRWQGWLGK